MDFHFGQRIKEISESKGLTAKDLAEMVGKTTQSVYAIFKKQDLGTDVIKEFADVLAMPIAIFFDETVNSPGINQVSGINHGSIRQHVQVGNLTDCHKELEKALMEIEYLKRENQLLRSISGKE